MKDGRLVDLLHSDSQQMVPESQQDENQQATGYPNAVEYQPVPTGLQPSGCSRTTGYQPYSAPVGQLHYAQPTNQQSEVRQTTFLSKLLFHKSEICHSLPIGRYL